MSESSLHPSSYIVLGLIMRFGEATSYDLKQWADGSVGYFWPFSRAQLYKEPPRLASLGYLTERQEDKGRRRRLYAVTRKGRGALRQWLASPTEATTELRDHGLLKLYFAENGSPESLDNLITDQITVHQGRLKEYEAIENELSSFPDREFSIATLRMGLSFEKMALKFWRDLQKRPPEI